MDPRLLQGLVFLVALILSICVHEFGHAFVADLLGDRLPRAQGRVTLNPLAHIDPIGTLLLPLVAMFSGPAIGSRILGWGKPVRISLSPRDITRKLSLRSAHALIAIAGPMMNILFALVLSGLYILISRAGHDSLAGGVEAVIMMNIGLFFFNLLPVPPLDGGAVLARLVPRRFESFLEPLNQYGFIILFVLLMSGLLSVLMRPASMVEYMWISALRHWAGGA
jgi:Zn-dependent protease